MRPDLIVLCWSNLWRRRLRTVVAGVGVAAAVAMLFSLIGFQRGYQRGLTTELDRLGAHILVVPKGCPYDAASIALHGASWPCYLKETYVDAVRSTAHVADAAPVLMNAVYDARTGDQVVYCGVDRQLLGLKRAWRLDGAFPSAGGVIVGAERARRANWRRGDTVALPGIDGGRARIDAILAPTHGADDDFFFLPLPDAQRRFGRPNELTHILVRLDAPERVDAVVDALRGCEAGLDMTVVPLSHLFRTIQSLVQSTRMLLGSVVLVALLCAAAGVANTVLMGVAERTREIGVLRALGAPRAVVFGLVWGETMLLCALAGLLGMGLAWVGGSAIEGWLRYRLPFVPRDPLLRPDLAMVGLCALGTGVLGTVAALLPAGRAVALAPAEALRP